MSGEVPDASEYVIKRLDEDAFELWHDDRLLATMTKEEAWPVMIGRVHPYDYMQALQEDGEGP